MLNLVPLNAMYREAVKAGVPLRSLDSLPDQFKDDFSPFTPDAAQARDLLNTRFNHYMNTVGWGGKSVGHTVRDHMTMYFRWRIVHVGQKILARRRHEPGWEAQRLADYDRQLAPERAAKQAEMYRLDHEYAAAIDARGRAFERMRVSASADPQELRSAYHQAAAHAEQVRWARIDQRSTLDTLPEPAPVLNAALESYDQQFLDDSDRVRGAERLSLTPFESILREAWETAPLTDAQVIAFFDEYVTDSLAGFDQDRTRATDFRWLYQGGDATVMYGDDSPEAQARRAREAAMAKQRAQWDLEAREYGWMR
jgi:hypothetical protein